jgi:hypothetical protein
LVSFTASPKGRGFKSHSHQYIFFFLVVLAGWLVGTPTTSFYRFPRLETTRIPARSRQCGVPVTLSFFLSFLWEVETRTCLVMFCFILRYSDTRVQRSFVQKQELTRERSSRESARHIQPSNRSSISTNKDLQVPFNHHSIHHNFVPSNPFITNSLTLSATNPSALSGK